MSEAQKTEVVENPQAIITYLFRNAGYASYQLSKMEIGNRIKHWIDLLQTLAFQEPAERKSQESQEQYDERVRLFHKKLLGAMKEYEFGTYDHVQEYAPGVFLPVASYRIKEVVGMYLRQEDASSLQEKQIALLNDQKKLFEIALGQMRNKPPEGDEWKQGGEITEDDM